MYNTCTILYIFIYFYVYSACIYMYICMGMCVHIRFYACILYTLISVYSCKANGYELCAGGSEAIVDSGTSYITFPSSIFNSFYNYIAYLGVTNSGGYVRANIVAYLAV